MSRHHKYTTKGRLNLNKQKSGISRNKLLVISGTGWMFDAMDVGILSFVIAAIAVEWQLTTTEMGWIGSMNSIGMAVGAFGFGLLADRIGRKNVFMMTLVLFSLASGLSAFTTTLTVFLILRFFVGAGLGGELPVASTLVSESVSAKERGRVVVLLESFWAAGWLIAALLAYFIIPEYGWRIALILTALPAFYAIYLRRGLPDSPKFVNDGKPKQSLGDKMKLIWSKQYARRTTMLWIVWFTVVFSYYGMFLWLPSVMVMKGFDMIHSFKYVLIMTLAQLPGYFTAAWLIERAGRKFVLLDVLDRNSSECASLRKRRIAHDATHFGRFPFILQLRCMGSAVRLLAGTISDVHPGDRLGHGGGSRQNRRHLRPDCSSAHC